MRIVKNVIFSLSFTIVPAMLAFPFFGWLARSYGVELFGVYTIILAIFGYASILDLGLSRGVIRKISLGDELIDYNEKLISTVSIFCFSLGTLFSLLLFVSVEPLVEILQVSYNNKNEVILLFEYAAFCIPLILLTVVSNSYFEGKQDFKILAKIKLINNTMVFLIPFFLSWIYESYSLLGLGLLLARLLGLCVSRFYYNNTSTFKVGWYFRWEIISDLFKYSGWLTFSNVISPIMTYFDRFVLSTYSGANNVAFYTGPSEIATKLSIFPASIMRVLFPMLARGNNQKFVRKNILFQFVSCGVIALIFGVLAEELIFFWLGEGFESSTKVLQILLVGFFFNSIAQVLFTQLQAEGYSKSVAFVHLIELPIYFLALIFLAIEFSYIGVALAWSFRMLLDMLILGYLSKKLCS
ncbi:flippase [Vibrio natriegens]|uniref:flippase n=1 Tax=Vibrio natriegens TaxID=691 RepID=UPI003DA16958